MEKKNPPSGFWQRSRYTRARSSRIGRPHAGGGKPFQHVSRHRQVDVTGFGRAAAARRPCPSCHRADRARCQPFFRELLRAQHATIGSLPSRALARIIARSAEAGSVVRIIRRGRSIRPDGAVDSYSA